MSLKGFPPLRPITRKDPYKMVFVCLGNICRSPTAEGVMQHLVNEAGFGSYFEIDSAGTAAYHTGEPANSKSRAIAEKHGVQLLGRARKFKSFDLDHFDLILVMDHENHDNVLRLCRTDEQREKVQMLRDYDPQPGDGQVPDPYYGGLDGFEKVFQIVKRSCEQLLFKLKSQVSV